MTDAPTSQINENVAFQRWFWTAQRVAWIVLGGLVLAALLGFTGGGGRFAQAEVGTDAMTLRFPAITRDQTESVLEITVNSDRPMTMLHFNADFQKAFTIVSMTPPPAASFATPWGVVHQVALAGQGAKTVRLVVSPLITGTVDYIIVVDGQMALLSSLILP